MKLGERLVRKGALTPEQVDRALKDRAPRERLGQALIRLGLATEEAVYRELADQAGLPFTTLDEREIPTETLAQIPVKLVAHKKVLPLEMENGHLRVAVSDPLDFVFFDELRLLLKREIQPIGATPSDIDRLIKKYYGVGAEEVDRLLQSSREEIEVIRDVGMESDETLQMAEDASLIKFVNQLLVEAVRERASDVHVEPMEREIRIRYRIDGVLHTVNVPPGLKRFQAAIVSRIKIMSGLNIAEKRLPQDGRIRLKVVGREIDIRVSIIPSLFGEGVVLRLLDPENILLSLTDLGMPSSVLAIWEELIAQPHGILLVTGPTGSGKTTSLYAALQKINSPADKIITVEDPVEYQLPGVKQIQVHPKIGLTFGHGLRAILRHDPDIIMIGEIRDLETAEIAVQAALTGHLVLSTLHTNDAPSAVTRLIDMGVEPYLVASTVEGVMAQRLVRRICKSCRQPVEREKEENAAVRSALPEDVASYSRGSGCQACRQTGYRGRTGLYELMAVDDPIKEMVVRRESAGRLKKYALDRGMKALRDDGWDRVRSGLTTPEEVLRITKGDRW